MVSETTARRFIICGSAAAVIDGCGGAYIGFSASSPLNLAVAALFFGLGYGIYIGSRTCAVIALAFFAFQRISMYDVAVALEQAHGGGVLMGFWISAALFTVLYALGVAGTFAWHARIAAAPAQGANPPARE